MNPIAPIVTTVVLLLGIARFVRSCDEYDPRDDERPLELSARESCLLDGGSWVSATYPSGPRTYCTGGIEVSP